MLEPLQGTIRRVARVRGRRDVARLSRRTATGVCMLATALLLSACTMQPPAAGGFAMPDALVADDGTLAVDLYAQFAMAQVSGATDDRGNPIAEIWTRAYSTEPANPDDPLDELPGPTLVFHPGDWLQITLHNQMNESANPWLKEAQDNIPTDSQDDIKTHIAHELNIPHNLNNTNLHVHGLHVDPKDDDATLLILPEDDDPSDYPPELQRLIPDTDRWWEWEYGYRLPADHLPGTHWYHAHQHGATAAHVENGMAGTLVIRPTDEADDIVPGLWDADPAQSHDRVLMFQEIANYGIQQGASAGPVEARQASATDNYTTQWPDIAVNGEHQPTLTLAPGQTERWRLINAGANHRTAGYLWVGSLTPPATMPAGIRAQLEAITDFESAKGYITIGATCPFTETFDVVLDRFPGTASLVAVDGITLAAAVPIAPDRPILMGPGNRADLYVQAEPGTQGSYYVAKNYNVAPPQEILAVQAEYGDLFAGDAGFWRYQALTTCGGGTNVVNVPGPGISMTLSATFPNLSDDPYMLGTNFKSFTQNWPKRVNPDGSIVRGNGTGGGGGGGGGGPAQPVPLAPLLTGQATAAGVDAVPISGEGFTFPGVGWAPAGGGPPSVVDSQVLMTVQVAGEAVTDSPAPPTDARLARLSPMGDASQTLLKRVDPQSGALVKGIPAYVSPIPDSMIAGTQVIVYDRSGINFNYQTTMTQTTGIQQFTINGRQFDLDDFVGNPKADALIQSTVPITIADDFDVARVVGTYSYNGAGNFSNQVLIGDTPQAFLTNPGYYVPVVEQDGYYTYDYANPENRPPTYQQVTGLTAPHQPEATTAEEWLLVNNSRIFHPFHIHINPFFVTEVGQVNYDGTQWSMKALSPDDPLGYIVNNWWDVIVIPPQGYVKIRFWFNIPDQKPATPGDPDSPFVIRDNANVFAAWVQHCHILRHEDRGMMMVVNVKPKAEGHSH